MIPRLRVEVTSDGVDVRLRNIPKKMNGQAKQACYTSLSRTLTKAKGYTPVKTGALRGSGRVEVLQDDPFVIEIMFGGPLAPYAPRVHEDLNAHHRVGQAKFLARAVTEDRQTIRDDIQKAVKP